MMVAARSQGTPAIMNDAGITIANSVGFTDLHADMAACAGYLSLSVGALSYALVKGGVSGFNHLVGNLTSSSVSASQRATEDLMSGNYSFGNVSLGSVQAYNESFGQHMHAPSYNSGYFSQNDGTVARVTGMDGQSYVNVANSQLRSSLNWGETMSSTFSEQASQALTASQNHSQAYTKSLSQGYRDALEFASHQASSQSHGESAQVSQQTNEQKSYTHLDSLAHNFAQENKISKDKAWQVLGKVSASLSSNKTMPGKILEKLTGISGSLEGSGQHSYSGADADLASKAMTFAKSDAFQKALHDTVNYAREGRFHQNDETSKRLNESLSSSLDKADSHRSETQASFQKAESYTKAAQYAKQNSTSLNASLNQDFVAWLPQQSLPHSQGPMGQQASDMLLSGETQGLIPYQQRFLETYHEKFKQDVSNHAAGSPQAILSSYETFQKDIPFAGSSLSREKDDVIQEKAHQHGFGGNFDASLQQEKKGIETQIDLHKERTQSNIETQKNLHRARADEEIPIFKKQKDYSTSGLEKSFTQEPWIGETVVSPSHEEPVTSRDIQAASDSSAFAPISDLSHKITEVVREEIHQALSDFHQEKEFQDMDSKRLGLKKS